MYVLNENGHAARTVPRPAQHNPQEGQEHNVSKDMLPEPGQPQRSLGHSDTLHGRR